MIIRVLRDKDNNIESIAIVASDIIKEQPTLFTLYKNLVSVAAKYGLILSDAKQTKNKLRG